MHSLNAVRRLARAPAAPSFEPGVVVLAPVLGLAIRVPVVEELPDPHAASTMLARASARAARVTLPIRGLFM
jgi:hypothetical protein